MTEDKFEWKDFLQFKTWKETRKNEFTTFVIDRIFLEKDPPLLILCVLRVLRQSKCFASCFNKHLDSFEDQLLSMAKKQPLSPTTDLPWPVLFHCGDAIPDFALSCVKQVQQQQLSTCDLQTALQLQCPFACTSWNQYIPWTLLQSATDPELRRKHLIYPPATDWSLKEKQATRCFYHLTPLSNKDVLRKYLGFWKIHFAQSEKTTTNNIQEKVRDWISEFRKVTIPSQKVDDILSFVLKYDYHHFPEKTTVVLLEEMNASLDNLIAYQDMLPPFVHGLMYSHLLHLEIYFAEESQTSPNCHKLLMFIALKIFVFCQNLFMSMITATFLPFLLRSIQRYLISETEDDMLNAAILLFCQKYPFPPPCWKDFIVSLLSSWSKRILSNQSMSLLDDDDKCKFCIFGMMIFNPQTKKNS